ncbi:MAG TPA: DUF4272 domain-containing protein [Gemmataceae bacterium]|nr:DUF4272 domain-containing protein [Gemmataceae bacterium]
MPENFAFYAQTYDSLPEEQMRALAGEADFAIEQTAEGRCFSYRWPGLTVTVNEMPAREVPQHLDGFCGYVRHIYDGKPDERGEQILDRIRYSRLVAGVVIEPKRDKEGRAEGILGAMAYGLHALMFYGSALYDRDSKLILAPDGSFDAEADVLGPVAELIRNRVQVKLPEREPYQPTPAQKARYRRVLKELKCRKVPTLSYALFIDDDEETALREPAEVARRLLVLSAVTYRADGGDRQKAVELIERNNLWEHVTPQERLLLEPEEADPDLAHALLWQLEGLWVMAWALGKLELPWPSGFCDVSRLNTILGDCESRKDFVKSAVLRPKKEILDALQLTLLQHWAIRDAFIHQREIPIDLDWNNESEMMPVRGCPTTGVVAERHHALNWLVRFGDADWDDVDTPT